MAIERKELPAIAKSAIRMQVELNQNLLTRLGGQALEAIGLSPDEGWRVNLDSLSAERTVPDEVQA